MCVSDEVIQVLEQEEAAAEDWSGPNDLIYGFVIRFYVSFVFHLPLCWGACHWRNDIPVSRVGCSISLKVKAHTPHHVIHSLMSSESDGAPSCRQKKKLSVPSQANNNKPGLDSNGLSLWNGIPPHALQIYLLFYLPGQAHGKIIPNTCRALSGTLE